jgi:hypothetical protein
LVWTVLSKENLEPECLDGDAKPEDSAALGREFLRESGDHVHETESVLK